MYRIKVDLSKREYVLFSQWAAQQKETAESPVNNTQQLKAEIATLVNEFCDLYDGNLSNDAVSLLLTELRQLSAV